MKITSFLTFVGDQCGKASEAIQLYTSIFPNSEIKNITKYADGEAGGTAELIKHAVITLNGVEYMVSENNYKHAWSFSPGVSLFVECDSEEQIQTFFEQLSSDGGKIFIPLDNYTTDNYDLGKKFGWCEDKYGISWQFNLKE